MINVIIIILLVAMLLASVVFNVLINKKAAKYLQFAEDTNDAYDNMKLEAYKAIDDACTMGRIVALSNETIEDLTDDLCESIDSTMAWRDAAIEVSKLNDKMNNQYHDLLTENLMLEDTIEAIYNGYDAAQEASVI